LVHGLVQLSVLLDLLLVALDGVVGLGDELRHLLLLLQQVRVLVIDVQNALDHN
jgi:hypothetical protein